MKTEHTIYTIGHSTHSFPVFLEMLQSFDIQEIVDIRSLPGSRKFPQFNQETLRASLAENGINYQYLPNLGGRRKTLPNSKNIRWNNPSFRGYADYMETSAFAQGIEELEQIAKNKTTAFMCSEAVWWRCHRSMVSDYLKAKGWTVLHIMGVGKYQEHPYTSPARVVDGTVYYHD